MIHADPSRQGDRVRVAGVGLLLLGLACYLTGPAWLSPEPAVAGGFEGPDLVGTAWAWWWTAFSMGHGINPFHCLWDFFPVGYEPVAMFNLMDAFLVSPFFVVLDPVRAYCAGIVLVLASVGWSGYAVCRWMGGDRLASLFGGVVLMSGSYVLGEVWAGRPGQALISFLVLGLGLWVRILRGEGTWRLAVAAAAMSALTFLSYWYYGLFLGLAVGVALLWRSRRLDPSVLLRAGLGLGLTLVAICPFVFLLMRSGSLLPGMEASSGWADHGALGQGEAGLNWALDSGLWVGWIFAPGRGLVGDRRLLWTLAICALAPLVGFRKDRGMWLTIALWTWLLTLGPYAKGQDGRVLLDLPLPFAWLYEVLPFFRRFWWPPRAVPPLLLALSVLSALNLTEMRRGLGRWGGLLPVAAILAWTVESRIFNDHFPLNAGPVLPVDAPYKVLDGPVITLPVFGSDGGARYALWMQIFHKQPILQGIGGHLDGHRPPAMDAYVRGNALLSTLQAYEDNPPSGIRVPAQDVQRLVDDGFRYILLDRSFYQPSPSARVTPLLHAFLVDLLGVPLADSPRSSVWRLVAPVSDYSAEPGSLPLPPGFSTLDEFLRSVPVPLRPGGPSGPPTAAPGSVPLPASGPVLPQGGRP